MLNENGLHPDLKKVNAIGSVSSPTDVIQLKAFLGLLNYMHSFLSMPADVLEPLNNITRDGLPWCWSKQCEKPTVNQKTLFCKNLL